jgi:creatinine amidohydrolase/Fe(II)-dependent formamide hydrolase-like protein
MRYGDLTYPEIAERIAAGWLALLPTGCTEQKGPHLPVDFDTWFAETLLVAASDAAAAVYGIGSLVLPALPFGPTPEHRSFGSGYIDLPAALHAAVSLRALPESVALLARQSLHDSDDTPGDMVMNRGDLPRKPRPVSPNPLQTQPV